MTIVVKRPKANLLQRIVHWFKMHLVYEEGQVSCDQRHCEYNRYGLCYLWGDGTCTARDDSSRPPLTAG